MYYIFKNNIPAAMGCCDIEPNHEDLETRGEFAVEYTGEEIPLQYAILKGKKVNQREPTDEEKEVVAESNRQRLLKAAGQRIAPLQDAFDLGTNTPAEGLELVEWKKYRVELMRLKSIEGWYVDTQWPEEPV